MKLHQESSACRLRKFALLLALVAAWAFTGQSLNAADRVALVIGNGRYQHLQRLDACPLDAARMATAFQKIGIRVYGGKPLIDLTADQMDAALNDFAGSLGKDTEAFIYYSGHGAQLGGSNYLLPIGFEARFESQARRQAVSLDSILELLERTDSKLRVVILDACRDPGDILPGEPKSKGAIYSKGLSAQRVEAPETLVCFATKHGTPSLANEKASYYTTVLAEEIVKPGEIGAIMRTVARRVYDATEKRQLPFTYGSLLQDHFFAGVPTVAVAPAAPPPPVVSVPQATPQAIPPMAKLTPASTPRFVPPPATPATSSTATSGSPSKATKETPFVNSLGMPFVPVPGTKVMFCVWDVRVQDYAEYAQEKGITPEKPDFEQGPTHPVVNVSWEDATGFCAWLSKKEGRTYRLPTDAEWSTAVGLGAETGATPEAKDGKATGYPWGSQWPPPQGAGNYDESLNVDSFSKTSPVGSFAPNRYGLYDMGGNVWQWCDDRYDAKNDYRVLRGGSWSDGAEISLRSSCRINGRPAPRDDNFGFRCVLVVSGG